MKNGDEITLSTEDIWVKLSEFGGQNWAVIDACRIPVTVYFINGDSKIFDSITFHHLQEATYSLIRNNFRRFHNPKFSYDTYLTIPPAPYSVLMRPIYSAGLHWI